MRLRCDGEANEQAVYSQIQQREQIAVCSGERRQHDSPSDKRNSCRYRYVGLPRRHGDNDQSDANQRSATFFGISR